MYQKRKERQEKSEENNGVNKSVINWDMPTNRKPHSNPYEIRKLEK